MTAKPRQALWPTLGPAAASSMLERRRARWMSPANIKSSTRTIAGENAARKRSGLWMFRAFVAKACQGAVFLCSASTAA